ncbi:NusA-like transcription termination signal-binding factor [Methanoculleus sp. FWC-SCC1]|uniref:Probable transcription termination protein NusA n=1 Tax=Methanoculleus frigidifontis TaxID=2584085 RepID=A0ABT8M869_9EURY|nr:NusA-like transcription termination signal-binding factor [Methanoculleus sp. FWC-SCC1]MDN7024132.1 NusA-like transcription termination signal-binding factor [Methanoculleus sp. FWC-SCC1]
MNRTICFKERRYIEELRILTRATAVDCIIDERFDRIIYVVREGDMGLAIGKKGANIQKMQKVLGRRVEMVEFARDPDAFVKNMFKPAEVLALVPAGENRIDVTVRKGDLGIAIGKGGSMIEKARLLILRFLGSELGNVQMQEDEHAGA